MEMLTIIFALASLVGAVLVIWSKTKARQQWLRDLQFSWIPFAEATDLNLSAEAVLKLK